MPQVDFNSLNLSFLIVAITVAVLATVFLGLTFLTSESVARRAPGVCALALAVIGLIALWLKESTYVVAGYATLATLLFVTWPIGVAGAKQSIVRWLPPKLAWVVILGASVVAARLLAPQVLESYSGTNMQPAFELQDILVPEMEAVTDQGTKVPLFHSRFHGPAFDVSLFALQMEAEQGQIIRLCDANPSCNCHGWVFTGGQYVMRDVDVSTILNDNGYAEVAEARVDDLAVYIDGSRVTHTGVVRLVDASGVIVVESKWGPFGVYLHPPERQPFSGACRYFRGQRPSHRLAISPVESSRAEADGPIADRSCPARDEARLRPTTH
jgi:hypothetical protein